VSVELPEGSTTSELKHKLCSEYSALSSLINEITLAVNQTYTYSDICLKEADEVAFLPPISGG
jgi:molybdopterin converting factor subunit 1